MDVASKRDMFPFPMGEREAPSHALRVCSIFTRPGSVINVYPSRMIEESIADPVDTGVPLDEEHGGGEAGVPEVEPEASEDEFVAVDETSESESGEQFAQRIRQRAERRSESAYKLLPQFVYEYRDREDFKTEVNEWYDYNEDRLFQLRESKAEFQKLLISRNVSCWSELSAEAQQELVQSLIEDFDREQVGGSATLSIKYLLEGCYGEASTVDDHMAMIKENCYILWEAGILPIAYRKIQTLVDSICPANPTATVNDSNVTNRVQIELDLNRYLTTIYLLIESLRDNESFVTDLNNLNPYILSYLVDIIGRLRWSYAGTLPDKKVLLLLWKCLLCLFGDSDSLFKVKAYKRKQYDLPEKSETDGCITSSPLDYHAFREDLMSRYPSYIPPPSQFPKNYDNSQSISHYIEVPRPAHTQQSNSSLPAPAVHIATPAPSPPSSPAIAAGQKVKKSVFMTNQSFPFIYPSEGSVPESIVEAGELFASRVRTSPAMVQLWAERDKFMRFERGWSTNEDDDNNDNVTASDSNTPEQVILDRIDKFYSGSFTHFYSFINVLLKVMLKCTSFVHGSVEDEDEDVTRNKEINLKAISAIFSLMLKWFKVSHVLKFEYFSTLLFDSRYYLLVYKFLYSHNVLERALYIPEIPQTSFFHMCKELSDRALDEYGSTSIERNCMSTTEARFADHIDNGSVRYLFSMINMIKVLRKIIKKKTQRIIIVAELPSETLRKALSIYHKELWRIILDIFKEQVPYNGRKWKYNNMDLVSAIYLHCKAKLRDDWLAGIDVSGEVDDAYAQEAATRALTTFYNNYNYSLYGSHNAVSEGESSESTSQDFFARELSALSLGSRVS